jgi:hypothetical protein
MIDRGHALSITRQAKALGISRSSVYCFPRPVSGVDLALMRGSTSCILTIHSRAAACFKVC